MQEDNEENKNRVIECSTIVDCFMAKKDVYEPQFPKDWYYNNDKCNTYSSCGLWKPDGHAKRYQGCILSKYCDIENLYKGATSKFTCPSGIKPIPKGLWVRPIDVKLEQAKYLKFQKENYRFDPYHGPLHYSPYMGGIKFPKNETITSAAGFKMWVDGGLLDYIQDVCF